MIYGNANKMIITILACAIIPGITYVVSQGSGMQAQSMNLNITNITFSDNEPVEGEEIEITAILVNSEFRRLSNISVEFKLDNSELGNVTDIILEPNESRNISITWKAENWEHNVNAMVRMGGIPLVNTMTGREIYVEAKPIGDQSSLVYVLILIVLVVLVTAITPSIITRIKR